MESAPSFTSAAMDTKSERYDEEDTLSRNPTQPVELAPSFSRTFGKRKVGSTKKTKFVVAHNTPATEQSKPKTAQDISRMLEMDALRLSTMKRDLKQCQAKDMERLQKELASLKREHDLVLHYNENKRKQIDEFNIRTGILRGVGDAVITTKKEAEEKMNKLQTQLSDTQTLLAMEQRTCSMLQYVHLRIYDEIGGLRKDSEEKIITLEKNKAELGVIENTLRYLQHEQSAYVQELDQLLTVAKTRRDQVAANRSDLNNLLYRSAMSIKYAKQAEMEVRTLIYRVYNVFVIKLCAFT